MKGRKFQSLKKLEKKEKEHKSNVAVSGRAALICSTIFMEALYLIIKQTPECSAPKKIWLDLFTLLCPPTLLLSGYYGVIFSSFYIERGCKTGEWPLPTLSLFRENKNPLSQLSHPKKDPHYSGETCISSGLIILIALYLLVKTRKSNSFLINSLQGLSPNFLLSLGATCIQSGVRYADHGLKHGDWSLSSLSFLNRKNINNSSSEKEDEDVRKQDLPVLSPRG